jgi:hypothetical protein
MMEIQFCIIDSTCTMIWMTCTINGGKLPWGIMEKLPMEERGGANHWRTSPRLEKDDLECHRLE